MTRVQYTGKSHFRQISAADLKSIGFENAAAISVAREGQGASTNPKNISSIAEDVPQEVADWLVKNERGDWKVLKEGEQPQQPTDDGQLRVGPDGTLPGATAAVEGAPDASGDAGSAGTAASGSTGSRAART